jgi:antitoxin component HigA of HigAB toxin-antitoxin module
MSTILPPSATEMPKTYADLIRLMVPRAIHDDIELENVTEIMDRLAVLDHPTADQADYLETMSTLAAAYEDTSHHIDAAHLKPLDTLKFLLKEHDLNASDLGRILGQRQLGATILRGDRGLSKTNIMKLAKHFGVSPSVFMS